MTVACRQKKKEWQQKWQQQQQKEQQNMTWLAENSIFQFFFDDLNVTQFPNRDPNVLNILLFFFWLRIMLGMLWEKT